ncbi:hypothetical protein K439DRAFT_1620281 [Ramaria rubella]|nr:hypothetical protein K439DRAFT_1620281 [Ramaria rubella]
MAILFYRCPALNISPKYTRSSALASPIKMLEENARGTRIKAITGDGANPADSISPMRDFESAPQLLNQWPGGRAMYSAWYEKDLKPYTRWSFFKKTSRHVQTELLSGSSPTLIGDTPPSKSTRSRKPSLAVDARTFHPSAIDRPLVVTGSHGGRVRSVPTKYIPTVVVPTRTQSQATEKIMGSEESKEDVGSLADFIVDNELDEDETNDVVDNDKVNHCGYTKDAQEEYVDEEVEDCGLNAEFPGQEEDMKEDTCILESDSEDEHSAASMILC